MQQYGLVSGEYMGNEEIDIDSLLDDAELMGYDLDDIYNNPEMLGKGGFRRFLRRVAGRIRERIQARRARKSGGSRGDEQSDNPYTISMPQGSLSMSQSGISWVRSPTGQMVPVPQQQAGVMGTITKNPAILIGGAVLLVLLLKKKKK